MLLLSASGLQVTAQHADVYQESEHIKGAFKGNTQLGVHQTCLESGQNPGVGGHEARLRCAVTILTGTNTICQFISTAKVSSSTVLASHRPVCAALSCTSAPRVRCAHHDRSIPCQL